MKQYKHTRGIRPYHWIIIFLVITVGLLTLYIANDSQTPQRQYDVPYASPDATYKFEYLRSRCEEGIQNYDGLLEEVKAESKRIQDGIDQANSQANIQLFNIYKEDNDNLKKSVNLIIERRSKLSSCIESVDQKLEFTASELADINSYIASSTAIPVTN